MLILENKGHSVSIHSCGSEFYNTESVKIGTCILHITCACTEYNLFIQIQSELLSEYLSSQLRQLHVQMSSKIKYVMFLMHLLYTCLWSFISVVFSPNWGLCSQKISNLSFKSLPHPNDFELAPFSANQVRNQDLRGSASCLKSSALGVKCHREVEGISEQISWNDYSLIWQLSFLVSPVFPRNICRVFSQSWDCTQQVN